MATKPTATGSHPSLVAVAAPDSHRATVVELRRTPDGWTVVVRGGWKPVHAELACRMHDGVTRYMDLSDRTWKSNQTERSWGSPLQRQSGSSGTGCELRV